MIISPLPPCVIAHIAAGEVIERPAYAVKELIENAIDANATHIHVDLREGGREGIVVGDNGTGMRREDLEASIGLHTTSKLHTLDDFSRLTTYGFRGEALASIAAVSRLQIASRHQEESIGSVLRVNNGVLQDLAPIGMPVGTRVTVEGLFSQHLPRQQQLKTSRTELRHTMDLISGFILSHPNIRFTVHANDRIVIDTTAGMSLSELATELLGESIGPHLVAIRAIDDPYVSMSGMCASPLATTTGVSKQYVLVNGRFVTSPLLSQALKEGYGSLLDPGTQPTAILRIQVPPHTIDVNVHPRKEQILFHHPKAVFAAVKDSISQTILHHQWTPTLQYGSTGSWSRTPTARPITQSYAATLLTAPPKQTDSLIYLGQVDATYLLFETVQAVEIIDQHAAHERILYHHFQHAYDARVTSDTSVALPTPLGLSLPRSMIAQIAEQQRFLTALGIHLVQESPTRVRITHVPALLQDRNIAPILQAIFADAPPTYDAATHHMLTSLACKTAIKAGDTVQESQARQLYIQLLQTPDHATCPHGRPTRMQLPHTQLATFFGRSSA